MKSKLRPFCLRFTLFYSSRSSARLPLPIPPPSSHTQPNPHILTYMCTLSLTIILITLTSSEPSQSLSCAQSSCPRQVSARDMAVYDSGPLPRHHASCREAETRRCAQTQSCMNVHAVHAGRVQVITQSKRGHAGTIVASWKRVNWQLHMLARAPSNLYAASDCELLNALPVHAP